MRSDSSTGVAHGPPIKAPANPRIRIFHNESDTPLYVYSQRRHDDVKHCQCKNDKRDVDEQKNSRSVLDLHLQLSQPVIRDTLGAQSVFEIAARLEAI
jgi:hypothetical protein